MKHFLILILTFVLTSQLYAGFTDSLSIGVATGYNNYNTIHGEISLNSERQLFNRRAEISIGINNRSYQLNFDEINDLEASSFGIFGDITIYPFSNGFFTGIRWEFINFNSFTDDSKAIITKARDYIPTSLYTGTCAFIQLGYQYSITDNFRMKIFGQPGIQQFRISNGSSSSSSYVQSDSDENIIIENNYKFIYNVNIGIEIKIN